MGILHIMTKRGDDTMTWGQDLAVTDATRPTELAEVQASAVQAVTDFFHEQYTINKMYRFMDTTDKANPRYLDTLTPADLATPTTDDVTEIRDITAFPRFIGG